MIGLHEKFQMSLGRIIELQEKEEELARAKALIARLRAENAVLKDEKKCIISYIDSLKRHISIAGNAHKKWAVTFVKTQLQKRFLL
jgi:hypothetical protein